jgi:hypothetical protein
VAKPPPSGLLSPRSGLARAIASLCRAVAEQGLAVVGAEQEGEPVQILAQLADVVCGIADELFQGGAEAARTPDAQSCSYESHCRWHHARRMRLPHVLVGFTRMKCAGTPSIHGSSPAPMIGARSASVSR